MAGGEGGVERRGGERGGEGEGGDISFHWLPIHHKTGHRCEGRQTSQKRTRPGYTAPSPQPSLIPASELSPTFQALLSNIQSLAPS